MKMRTLALGFPARLRRAHDRCDLLLYCLRGFKREPTPRPAQAMAGHSIRRFAHSRRMNTQQRSMHVYEVRPRSDKRGFDLISDALPFVRLWYGEPDAVSNAIGYARFFSRSHDAVIRVYDEAGNVIATHEHIGDFKVTWLPGRQRPQRCEVMRSQMLSPSMRCDPAEFATDSLYNVTVIFSAWQRWRAGEYGVRSRPPSSQTVEGGGGCTGSQARWH